MLSSYRVLDLTDERGQLCSYVLASLGAEVIAIEPPGGSSSRRLGPFAGDEEGPERSLRHWAYSRGKRSVVLDLDSDGGRDHLRRLAAGADVLVESSGPGVLDALGLGHDELAALNPALVYVSISPFGSDGPKAGWAASDLTIMAAGGPEWLTGDEDRPPLRCTAPQAYLHAAADAAGAALIALHERQRSGLGQHVDVSAQQSVTQATQSTVLAHDLQATPLTRVAGGTKVGPFNFQLMWPCKDGYVSVTLLFGAAIGPFTRNLMTWACEEGFVDEATRDKDWINYGTLLFTGGEPPEEYERVKRALDPFFLSKTKAELLQGAFDRRLLIAPCTTTRDVVDSPQLEFRDFWEDVDQGSRLVRYPGPLAKLSATPLTPLPAGAALGADTEAVLAEAPRRPAVTVTEPATVRLAPFDGLKVLDLQWVMAGPAVSRVLADYGATVVRVESGNRVDTARTLTPFRGDGQGVDDSGLFNNMNAGKLGLALDLGKPGAREVILDLVQWADLVLESFSPRAMKGWGLDYESLRQLKPDLIMGSTCLMGQTGPYAPLAGYGTMASAISGFFNLAGWTDRSPCGPFGAYTDYVAPKLYLPCVLAALEHRRVTGQGQYIDLAQGEAALQFLAPALLDEWVNGRTAQRDGNDDPTFAPHGVYPALGTERWVAVACTDDDQWVALCDLVGRTDLAGLDAAGRRARRRELDGVVAGWTAGRELGEIEDALQARGIAAHRVNDSEGCTTDPQLVHRGHFVEVAHGAQGTTTVEGSRYRLSATPGGPAHGGPTIGEHVWEVLNGVLGYDADQIADLAVAELLE